jgi:hypothetical protein
MKDRLWAKPRHVRLCLYCAALLTQLLPPPPPLLRYITRFPTRMGYLTVRLPYASFRPETEGQPALDPEAIRGIGLRYENRRATAAAAGG